MGVDTAGLEEAFESWDNPVHLLAGVIAGTFGKIPFGQERMR
jgi:hypothetical protein